MAFVNNSMIIRKQLLRKVAELHKNGELEKSIDRIPIDISPRDRTKERRCCIHKERAVSREKLIPLLGCEIDHDDEGLTRLSEYVKETDQREKPIDKILQVVDESCTSCVKANYIVTNLCKGCVGSPCIVNCPKDAVSKKDNGQAVIDAHKCISCGICQSACPYHSIIYMPIPCEESCPVGAISQNENGIEQIDEEKCIMCGKCVTACPFGSIMETSQLLYILKAIDSEKEVVAMVAPAILSQFRSGYRAVVKALKEIGFSDVVEVAKGANITTQNETNEYIEKMEEGQTFMTTSCCPSYVLATDKHIKDIKPYVSHTKSPMYYTAEMIKAEKPEAITVFIGPCIAKRHESMKTENVDYVMTFEEVGAVIDGWDITMDPKSTEDYDHSIDNAGRGYAKSGGVTASIKALNKDVVIREELIDGLNKKSIKLLKTYAKKKNTSSTFFEVMACEGGCIQGPSPHANPKMSNRTFKNNLDSFIENGDED